MAPRLLYWNVPDYEYGIQRLTNFYIRDDRKIYQLPMPTTEELKTYYHESYSHHTPSKFLAKLKDIQAKGLVKKCRPSLKDTERILEIGSGDGRFTQALRLEGYNVSSVISDFENTVFSTLYDVIFMHNVIEHFADPAAVIDRCYNLLTPQGKLIIRTPNTDSLSHRVFKRYWAGLQAPRHTWLFNRYNLRLMIDRKRFWITNYIPFIDSSTWAISIQNFLVSRGLPIPKGGIAWYSYPLMVLCWPLAWFENLLGKSSAIFCVYYKYEKEETKA